MQKEIVHADGRTLRMRSRISPIALMLGALAIAACREGSATPKAPTVQQSAPSSNAPPAVLATIGDDKITMSDIQGRAGDQLEQLEMQYQLAKTKIVGSALDSILREKTVGAEAKKTGKSVDELIAAEAGPAGLEPSDVEIGAWYKENQGRVGGRTLEQVRSQIVDLLRGERHKAAEKKLVERLRTDRKVVVSYEPFRLQFNNENAPTLGRKDAPVTLVEFSDFQCPYCQAAAPTIKQVEQKFGDKVQIVYRQFPLTSIHPFAFKAAEASLCANEQGKFWQMHDQMFQDQKKLSVSDLKATARQLGLDGKKFDNCLDSGRYVEQVQNDQKEGQRIGINGTPAMFINGTIVEGGSVPFSVLQGQIENELSRTKR